MKHIVIVESPAKCKTIEKYLGKDYKVLASYGHIRDLPSKNGSVLPDEDFKMNYVVESDSKKNVKAIEDAVKNADSLILATDPDREGEAISWHVWEVLLKNKSINKSFPVKRVSFDSITKDAVQNALANPRELDMNLINAQQARRALDYLVGFTLSPVLWRKLPGSRSAGRVQSVALRLICEREGEIELFKADEYWSVHANFLNPAKAAFDANLNLAFGEKLAKLSIGNKENSDKILAAIKNQKFTVAEVEKKQVQRFPKPPFTTSTLQQEASRKLGFSVKKTMQVAQKLYEGIQLGGETAGLITYMRTDGVDVAPEAVARARSAIAHNFGDKYVPEKPRAYKSKLKNAQEAHEAIRPTDPARTPEMVEKYLDADQQKLYELIWKRLVASQMESAQLNQVAVDIASEDKKFNFRANGQTIVFDGFLKLYREDIDDGEDEDKEGFLPPLVKGDALEFNPDVEGANPSADQHFTQPPPRYNEASLVKRLEELGIGRPSTYASIISVLQDRGYVKLEKKRFTPEMRGRLVTYFLEDFFSKYVEYDFTANLEEQLDLVSDGKLDWKKALKNFWEPFKQNIDSAMEVKIQDVLASIDKDMQHIFFSGDDIEKARTCPKCGVGKMGLKTGKFGAFLGCSNYPTCNNIVNLDQMMAEMAEEKAIANGQTEEEKQERAEAKKEFAKFETKIIGKNDDGVDITLRKGPYGFYLQVGEAEGKNKPKRASIPKGVDVNNIDIPYAKQMLALPRIVGKHPDTGEEIKANIGMFGPYLFHNKQYYSLKNPDKLFTVEIDEAVSIVNVPKKHRGSGRGGFKKGKGKGKSAEVESSDSSEAKPVAKAKAKKPTAKKSKK
jgi:DNA topoisomerase-1